MQRVSRREMRVLLEKKKSALSQRLLPGGGGQLPRACVRTAEDASDRVEISGRS